MVHVPAKFREDTLMRFQVTVRKLNVTDGQTDRQTDGGVAISPVPGPMARREIKSHLFSNRPRSRLICAEENSPRVSYISWLTTGPGMYKYKRRYQVDSIGSVLELFPNLITWLSVVFSRDVCNNQNECDIPIVLVPELSSRTKFSVPCKKGNW